MADQDLLKFARAGDDTRFVWRVAAAMTLQAQEYELKPPAVYSPEAKQFTNWVLDNPLVADGQLLMHVAANSKVVALVTITPNGEVDTTAVLDADIKYMVRNKWEAIAKRRFRVEPVVPA